MGWVRVGFKFALVYFFCLFYIIVSGKTQTVVNKKRSKPELTGKVEDQRRDPN